MWTYCSEIISVVWAKDTRKSRDLKTKHYTCSCFPTVCDKIKVVYNDGREGVVYAARREEGGGFLSMLGLNSYKLLSSPELNMSIV